MNTQDILAKKQEDFDCLYELYREYNEHTNISAIRDKADVYSKHFLDSLEVVNYISENLDKPESKILDLGTGGGFPALPLAIALKDDFPSLQIVALDSVAKKINFIDTVKDKLALNNLTAIHSRAEELARDPNFRESFDLVLSRAVANLPVLLEYCIPFLKTGSSFIAYKSNDIDEELKLAANAMEMLGVEIRANHSYKTEQSEDADTKQLIFFRKLKATEDKYPRPAGKVTKNPL